MPHMRGHMTFLEKEDRKRAISKPAFLLTSAKERGLGKRDWNKKENSDVIINDTRFYL